MAPCICHSSLPMQLSCDIASAGSHAQHSEGLTKALAVVAIGRSLWRALFMCIIYFLLRPFAPSAKGDILTTAVLALMSWIGALAYSFSRCQ